jgi:hypothetical protein
MLGGQYNYPISPLAEITWGVDVMWVELYGNIDNVNKQVEVFIPFITGGAALNFDQWRIFGKIGYALSGSVNIIGSGKGWNASIFDFNMGTLQLGIKYPIYNGLSISTSAGYYFGKRIEVETRNVIFSTLNVGLSYNLFLPEVKPIVVSTGVDEFREKYYASQAENRELFKQIIELHDKIKDISSNVSRTDTVSIPTKIETPSVTNISVEKISIDSINATYNLNLRRPLNVRDFVNKRGLKEEGKLILGEYNNIASSFKRLPAGIYFLCTVADAGVFKKNESEFPRIKFQSDPSFKNNLVIDIDIKATETNNKIKIEVK